MSRLPNKIIHETNLKEPFMPYTDSEDNSMYDIISHTEGDANCGYKKKKGNDQIWMEDPSNLFKDSSLMPNEKMTHNQRFNTITRLIVLIFIIMFALKYKHSVNFLCLALIIIFILYFTTSKEYYQMDSVRNLKYPLLNQTKKSSVKMSVAPVIAPPIADKDVWSLPSYRNSAINYNNAQYDITDQFATIPEKTDPYPVYDPRLSTYTGFDLERWGEAPKVAPVRREVIVQSENPYEPGYVDPSENPQNNFDMSPYSTAGIAKQGLDLAGNFNVPVIESFGNVSNRNNRINRMRRFSAETPIANVAPNTDNTNNAPLPSISVAPKATPISQVAPTNPPRRREQFIDSNFATIPESSEEDYLPDQNLLIPKTITSIYGKNVVTQKERMKYMTSIGPGENYYSDVAQPINANMGISYNPEQAPMVLDQVVTPIGHVQPLFHSIDPQLVRERGLSKERMETMPRRTKWSAKYSGFDAADGTVNFEDIYDPRFNGYGDPYRSYSDVNLGQVQYYYSDIDAYRDPNFGGRSKIDFLEYTNPMGKTIPEYDRKVGVNDIKKDVENQWHADTIYQREDLMTKLMSKRNSELWQLRQMPLRKNQNASHSSAAF